MSFSIEQLRKQSDADIIHLHDEQAKNTFVGVDYYLDELRRREMAAAMKSSHRLSQAAVVLSAVNTVVAVVAIGALTTLGTNVTAVLSQIAAAIPGA